ncbi:MAG: M48 family metallopeptidase [Spirochaetota bacterium]
MTTDANAKEYNRIKVRLNMSDMVLSLVYITILAFSGLSPWLLQKISMYAALPAVQFLLFVFAAGLVYSVVSIPMDFYAGYIIEHRYNLSNQTLTKWLWDKMKGFVVGLAIGVPILLAFFYFIQYTGENWWLYFSTLIFAFSVLLARLAPVVLFPIFYKFSPLENDDIRRPLLDLLDRHNIDFKGIYSFDMSKETKKANAGFTGLGKSKRIILSDTLIENFTPSEITVIFAHELGHYKKRHIIKNILISGVVIFAMFYLCGQVYNYTWTAMGFTSASDIAAIPVLFFYLSIFSLLLMPATNAISRAYEREADRFAIEVTSDTESFITAMDKLAQINLADRNPHPFIEWFMYSHPSIQKRIDFAREL